MPDVEPFFDTNIVLYALSKDFQRKEHMAELLNEGCTLSTQVFAESANVMRRKFSCSIAEIENFHDALLDVCRLRRIESSTIRRALQVAGRYGYSLYDSLIIATALEADCERLYSEDMQHGQLIDKRLTIINPFR